MARETRECDEFGVVLVNAGERILAIEPVFDRKAMAAKWIAIIEVPGQVLDFAEEKEKRK